MRKRLSVFLALLILVLNYREIYAADISIDDYTDAQLEEMSDEIEGKKEEERTDEEKEILRQIYIRDEWNRQVDKYKDKSIEELTTSYLLGDFSSGEILLENNIDDLVAIASISKVLSIYVAMDEIKNGNISLDDKVLIDKDIEKIGGSSYKLKEGEKVSVKELIEAALIVSGNDAVTALAKHIAGTETNFVNMMKDKLEELDIKRFVIINASGLPDYNIDQQNMMTPRDLFKLTRSFLADYPEILEITSEKELNVPERNFKEKNTNPILTEIPEIDGLKTGYTGIAGRCVISTGIKRGDKTDTGDIRFIGITMGSNSDAARYVAIKKLMNYAFENYEYKILGGDFPVEVIEDEDLKPEKIEVYPEDEVKILKNKTDMINYSANIYPMNLPLSAGEKIGDVTYFKNGDEVFKTSLIVKTNVDKGTFLSRLARLYESLFEAAYYMFNE